MESGKKVSYEFGGKNICSWFIANQILLSWKKCRCDLNVKIEVQVESFPSSEVVNDCTESVVHGQNAGTAVTQPATHTANALRSTKCTRPVQFQGGCSRYEYVLGPSCQACQPRLTPGTRTINVATRRQLIDHLPWVPEERGE